MKATLLIGSGLGLSLASAALAAARFGEHTFGWEIALIFPAVLPFGTSDPEQEAGYGVLAFAVLLNGCVFASVAAAVRALANRISEIKRDAA